ncbi:MAG: LemA family protein [Bdellovibrionales bacterium]|nr:LemA family protein [Bdellovibrionales bacterium]
MIAILIFLGVLIVFFLYLTGVYNSLVALRNHVKNAWSQIDVQLKRRHDLIPNLVETAKGYLKHERETLEAVIQARNQAVHHLNQVNQGSAFTPGQAQKAMQSESILTGALSKLMVVMEQYPELKANQNMIQVSEELTSTENRIGFARQAFNDATTQYNIRTESFPDLILARLFKFDGLPLWELEDKTQRQVPKVSFSS